LAQRSLDIREFARRVERLCDFFLAKVSEETGRTGSSDIKVIEDLKEDAADIQSDRVTIGSETLFGLNDYMAGVNVPSSEEN